MVEKRFDYLKDLSTEELKEELEKVKEDLEFLKKKMEDKNANSYEKSEINNTDIPYNRDKIAYIEEELKSRTM